MVGQCLGQNRDGTPCSGTPRASGYCMWHDPALAADRRSWRAKGGANRANKRRAKKALPAEPLSTAELHSYLGVVFRGVIGGKIEPGVATAAANVARTMAELLKTSELEERMDEIERKLRSRAS